MMPQERLVVARNVLSELAQAHFKAALCAGQLQDLFAADIPPAKQGQNLPIADDLRFCVQWRNRTCHFGRTRSYALFVKLLRRCNHYVSYDDLLQDVWQQDSRSDDTIRSAVRELKSRLCRAGMRKLAQAIKGQRRHYALMLERS